MKEPGTAYDDPRLGKDPQPDHMDGYVETTEDNGGVHINSGIPNRAFALAAPELGGYAWEGLGQVWYDVLTGDIRADCDFATFAALTIKAAGEVDEATPDAVAKGWETVGVIPARGQAEEALAPRRSPPAGPVTTRPPRARTPRSSSAAPAVSRAAGRARGPPPRPARRGRRALAGTRRDPGPGAGLPGHLPATARRLQLRGAGPEPRAPAEHPRAGPRGRRADLLDRMLRED